MESIPAQVENWDLNIAPKYNPLSFNFRELWGYRDLLIMFVRKDIVTVYKQTLLGPIWFVLQPLLTTFIFVILFGRIAGLSPDGVPQFAFYLIGITVWSYFAETLNITSKTFADNANIFGKVYFPRLILPISKVISGLIKFLMQLCFFLCFWIYYVFITKEIAPNIYLILTPFLLLIMVTIALGFGILITSLTTKYRDLTFLISFGIQLLMYATPVAYSMSNPKVQKFGMLIWFNPLTALFEAFKYGLLGKGTLNFYWIGYSAAFAIFILLFGIIVFNRVERRFVDTV